MRKIRKVAASMVLASTMLVAQPSNAIGIPSMDISLLAENIAANIQSAYQWAEQKMIALSQMDLQSMLSKFEIDSLNNAMSNVIVRVNKALEDTYNQKVVEMAKPDRDACKNLSVRLSMDDVVCALSTQNQTAAATRIAAIKANSQASTTVAAHDSYIAQEIKTLKTSCMSMTVGSGTNMLETECARIENLTQGPLPNASSSDRQKTKDAAENAVKIMTNQAMPRKTTNPDLPDTVATQASRTNDLRFTNYKGLAIDSFNQTNNILQVATGLASSPTQMELLKKFDDDHWGSSDWIQEITNTSATKLSDPVSETELLRKMTVMQAFNVHMDLLQYESQIRNERLNAAKLDLILDPFRNAGGQ